MENQETKIGAEKEFSVPTEQLYKAWITPEDLKQWWQPSENHLKTVELDVREGGSFRYEFETKEGQPAVVITGDYKEVKPNERLVYTWNWDVPNGDAKKSDHQLTIEFQSTGSGSKLSVTQENFQEQEAVNSHQQGWDKSLNDLHDYLSK